MVNLSGEDLGAISQLPTSGNCSNFSPPVGDQSQNRPDQSFQLKLQSFNATKFPNSIDLQISGITNMFPGDSGSGNDFIQGATAWYVIKKCDVATGEFSTITDGSTHRLIVDANSTEVFTFSDINLSNTQYYYVAYATMSFSENFGNLSPSTNNSQSNYEAAIARYANGDATTKITWSDPLYLSADFSQDSSGTVAISPSGHTWTDPNFSIEMIRISSGTFMMGSPDTETARGPDEGPQHQVTISKDFYLGKYEVTQEQWGCY